MMSEEAENVVLAAWPDLYAVLGVSKQATPNEMKKAYHKRALFLHPDKNNSARATEAFKLVGIASETLSDETKREIYDAAGGGEAGLKALQESTHEGPSFLAFIVAVLTHIRYDLDPYEAARYAEACAGAARQGAPLPMRNPEPFPKRYVVRALGALVLAFGLMVLLSVETQARLPTASPVALKRAPGSYDVPVTVLLDLPASSKPRAFKKAKGGRIAMALWGRAGSDAKATMAAVERSPELKSALIREWKVGCQRSALVAQAAAIRGAVGERDARDALPGGCELFVS
jgi:hypothetical protein